jgi:transcriptional regulator with GAF, ATPase, and Fis domain
LLDEVGELPLHLQAKLLRVLQERSFERLGGSETVTSDVRILAATNRNLLKMVQMGTFREDLYYRLNVVQIESPPLRKRREDIPELVHHFIKKYSTQSNKRFSHIPQKAMVQISTYSFPGNVRELENLVERAVVLSSGEELNLGEIFQGVTKMPIGTFPSLDEIQKQHILKAIRRCGGKISGPGGAAQLLGVNNKTLYSKMKRLGIDPKNQKN